MKKIIFSLLCLSCLLGCKKSNDFFPHEICITGKMLSVGDSLGIPFTINIANGYFIFRDFYDNTCLTMLKSDMSFCYHFGERGEGPNEVIDLGPVLVNGSSFSVYDGGKMSLLTYSTDSLLQHIDRPLVSFKTELEGSIISLINISDSVYIATGSFPCDKRFSILNSKGEMINAWGEYEIKEQEKDIPFYIKGVAYLSDMERKPGSNRFAVATRYGGVLEIYDFNPQDMSITKVADGAKFFTPRLTTIDIQGSLNFAPDKDTRWGYLYLSSDSQYIYGLYSGMYQREGEPFISGNTVHVFSWDGLPICQLILDKRVRDIAVQGNKLYGLYEDTEIGYEIIEYVLPDNLR
ncbi:BF3164 family lipoprotein [Phocaeicola faecalis]